MKTRTWYSVARSQFRDDTAEISIHDEIGMFGISARNFIADLKSIGPVQRINMSIHSPGGEVLDGIAIYNALQNHPAQITATIEGVAASMASVIAMAADHIVIPGNAFMMIHNPWGVAVGDAQDMTDTAAILDKMRESAVSAYQAKTDLPREKIIELMDAETWMTGTEALDLGFADELRAPLALAALSKFDNRRFNNMPAQLSTTPEAETAAPVEPTAPAVEVKAEDTTETTAAPDPVEPTAPADDAATEETVTEPQGFVARALASLRSLLPAAEPEEVPVNVEPAGNKADEIADLRRLLASAEAELSLLRPKARERDELEVLLSAAQGAAKSASVRAAEIAASAGFKEVEQLPALRASDASSVTEQFNAISDPGARSEFFRANANRLRAERIAQP